MDEQLNHLPCGYFALTSDWEFIEMNQTMKDILQVSEIPRHMHDVLTVPSRIYFQTYYVPAMAVHGIVREMYLNFKVDKKPIPVLMNVNEKNGRYIGIIVQIKVRDEYETQLLQSKKDAERIQKETDAAYNRLLNIMQEVESKQKQLLQLNDELHELTTRDELTGLYNRRFFYRYLDAAIDHAECLENKSFSLLLFDIDYFKKVNDTYGHSVGDDVLKELSRKLEQKIKMPNIVARIGGEEFAVIYDNPNHQYNVKKAEELRCYLEESTWTSKAITVSLGITNFQYGDKASHIYVRADDAQYASKRNGRNRLTSI